MTLYDGSISFLWERPITLSILSITVLVLLMPLISSLRKSKKTDNEIEVAEI